MLREVTIKNLTVFSEVELACSPHLNVIVGTNGTGKSHLLKVIYAVLAASAELGREAGGAPTKEGLQRRLAEKLVGVMQPDALGRLARRQRGGARCEVALAFEEAALDVALSFSTRSKTEVALEEVPKGWVQKAPVFLPTRELLTLAPGFVSLYNERNLMFEETWRDTCLLLGAPTVKGARAGRVRELLSDLEGVEGMWGTVEQDKSGRFYLNTADGRLEMPLVAEGVRKLATVARLIATGSLLDQGYLFWDEPDANLNPALVKVVARSILQLAKNGVQTWIATHSLFLMRELDILLATEFKALEARFVGLHQRAAGVCATQGGSLDEIGEIASLDEALMQSDRYLALEG